MAETGITTFYNSALAVGSRRSERDFILAAIYLLTNLTYDF
jgi:hypothetical protein